MFETTNQYILYVLYIYIIISYQITGASYPYISHIINNRPPISGWFMQPIGGFTTLFGFQLSNLSEDSGKRCHVFGDTCSLPLCRLFSPDVSLLIGFLSGPLIVLDKQQLFA
jgi:hypothetical protein